MDLLAPLSAHRWDESAARHLLNRVGFGPTAEEVTAFAMMGIDDAVDTLIHPERTAFTLPPPSWATAPPGTTSSQLSETESLSAGRISSLRQWWVQRMHTSPRPLEEKMTLFWHSHFATQSDKVTDPLLLYRHNQLLRDHGLDFFNLLVLRVARDAAMVRFLDLDTSQSQRPNDNFARELMELYTLGEGNYSETDVREAARAFTGWTVQDGRAVLDPRRFDDGRKTFLGRTGPWRSEDIIRILFEQPTATQFVTTKLFSFFAYPDPEPEVVTALADSFADVHFSIRDWLARLFRSELFYSTAAQGSRVKSPAEYVIGLYRQLGIDDPPFAITELAMRRMGQELLNPPDVDGWKEGTHWINAQTLMMRYHFAYFCTTGTVVEGLIDRNRSAYRAPERITDRSPLFQAADWIEESDYGQPTACARQAIRRIFGRPALPAEEQRWSEYLQTASNNARVDFHLGRRMPRERFQSAAYLLLCSPEYQVC